MTVNAKGECSVCGLKVTTVERASGGYVEILAAPSPEGRFMRLPHGPQVGRYVKLDGPLLVKVRQDGVRVYAEHTCAGEGLF